MSRTLIRFCAAQLALLLLAMPMVTGAQADNLADALEDIGISDAQVTVADDGITVAYDQPIAGIGPWESVLYRVATIVGTCDEHSNDVLPVILRVTYDDGNVMQITGQMDDAAAFLEGDLTPDEYDARLDFQPLTRGPAIVAETCHIAQEDTCANSEACACYPNESCEPEDDAADLRGCVVSSEPENARLQDGQYVCDDGYVWNAGITACELPQSCPSGTFAFNGECVSRSSSAATDYDDYGGGYKPLGGLVGLCGAALCLLVPVVLVVVLVLRRRKRRRAEDGSSDQTPASVAAPASALRPEPAQALPATSAPLPPPPLLPEAFLALEKRHSELRQSFAAGQLSQDAYHQALRQLVVQDARGHWAYSSGQWMWFDGTQWVPRHPL